VAGCPIFIGVYFWTCKGLYL